MRTSNISERRTTTPPPGRDYLTRGVLWSEAVTICEEIADKHPEVAPRYLRWLASEARMAVLGEGPMHGPNLGWTQSAPLGD